MGLPWHRRGWQIGCNSSDLASAGQVSAVGSGVWTKALYLGGVYFEQFVFHLAKVACGETRAGAGGAGKGRNRAHPTHAKLPHAAHPGPGLTFLRLQSQLFGTLFGGISRWWMSQKVKNLKRSGKN